MAKELKFSECIIRRVVYKDIHKLYVMQQGHFMLETLDPYKVFDEQIKTQRDWYTFFFFLQCEKL